MHNATDAGFTEESLDINSLGNNIIRVCTIILRDFDSPKVLRTFFPTDDYHALL